MEAEAAARRAHPDDITGHFLVAGCSALHTSQLSDHTSQLVPVAVEVKLPVGLERGVVRL